MSPQYFLYASVLLPTAAQAHPISVWRKQGKTHHTPYIKPVRADNGSIREGTAFGSTPAYALVSPTGFDQYVPHTMQAGFGD